MNATFADTSYYLALLTPGDEHHSAALQCSLGTAGIIVVTDFVLLEVGNTLSRSRRRAAFPELVRNLRADPDTEIVPLSQELLDKGLDLYARRPDQEWSLTDCISFVVMGEHGLTEALTADHHFEQAGFTVLLK
jgi:uncharacterized protein